MMATSSQVPLRLMESHGHKVHIQNLIARTFRLWHGARAVHRPKQASNAIVLLKGKLEIVRIARTASTRISESEDASHRRCRPYDIGRISMHCCPLPLDNQEDKAPGAGEAGHKIQADSLAGDSRRVTPLGCIHRPMKPLDGRMVVAKPYLLCRSVALRL